MTEQKTNDHELLPDGRVMKGNARIEAVNTKYERRMTLSFQTYQCNRLVRRDFNMMSVKLVMLSRNPTTRLHITELLADIAVEAGKLSLRTADVICDEVKVTAPLSIRIVSPEAHQLFDALVTYDLARAKLFIKEVGDAGDRQCTKFLVYYGRLKSLIFQPAAKTARGSTLKK